MTRWARANNVHKHKPAEATPWNQLRGRGRGGHQAGSDFKHRPQRDQLRGPLPGSSVKKPNRKKKDYDNEDVNGFLEYLQQSGQPLPKANKGGREEEEQIRQEVHTALKKDQRREDRRIKRQKDKKNNMVSDFTLHYRYPDACLVLIVVRRVKNFIILTSYVKAMCTNI